MSFEFFSGDVIVGMCEFVVSVKKDYSYLICFCWGWKFVEKYYQKYDENWAIKNSNNSTV